MSLRPGLTQEAHTITIDSLAQAFALTYAAASGTITCAASSAGADGDIVTVGDGINPAVTFEYDKSSNGVTSPRTTWPRSR